MDDLKERVLAFKCMELPGQPMMMHMGTSYLVNDLWSRITSLEQALEKIAGMTDIEADFDGFEARAIARAALRGEG